MPTAALVVEQRPLLIARSSNGRSICRGQGRGPTDFRPPAFRMTSTIPGNCTVWRCRSVASPASLESHEQLDPRECDSLAGTGRACTPSQSFHRSKLRTVCSSYFAYEHARSVRQVLIRRLLLLVLGTSALTLGAHLIPIAALIAVAALAAACFALCLRTELKARRRLINELRDIPSANSLESR